MIQDCGSDRPRSNEVFYCELSFIGHPSRYIVRPRLYSVSARNAEICWPDLDLFTYSGHLTPVIQASSFYFYFLYHKFLHSFFLLEVNQIHGNLDILQWYFFDTGQIWPWIAWRIFFSWVYWGKCHLHICVVKPKKVFSCFMIHLLIWHNYLL